MKVVKFSEELFKPVAKLCRQNMELDIMPDFLFREKTFDDPDYNPELTLVAIDEKEIPIGFIQGVIRDRSNESVGYIKLLCVDSNQRRKRIASNLYHEIEEKFIQNKIKRIRVYESYPNYFMPGVDPFYTEAVCFFERMRFKKFKGTSNLKADLITGDFNTEIEEAELRKGNIICRRAFSDEKEKVLKWVDEKFPIWHFEVEESFKNNPATLFITEVNGEVKAFSVHEVNNKGTGWFGPMGTDDIIKRKRYRRNFIKKIFG